MCKSSLQKVETLKIFYTNKTNLSQNQAKKTSIETDESNCEFT